MSPLDYALIALIAAAVNVAAAIWNVRQGLRARRKAVNGGEPALRAGIRSVAPKIDEGG